MLIGIIGYGSIGDRHCRNLLAHQVELVVLTKRQDVAGVPVVHSWGNFRKRGPFDAIFIANETYKHVETIRKCLPLKPRALFVEKPVSHTLKGLAPMEAILQQRNISCWVGYNLQFFKPLQRIKNILDNGRLGKLYSLRVSVGQDLREWRKRDHRVSYSSGAGKGGGVMLDLIHDINYPAWLLGEPLHPVAALVKRVSTLQVKAEDCAESLLCTHSGVLVSVHQDYVRIPDKRSLEIVAERGTLEWNTLTDTIQLWVGKKYTKENVAVDRNDMYKAEISLFLKKLKSGRYFSNMAEAVRDVQLIDSLKKYEKFHTRR